MSPSESKHISVPAEESTWPGILVGTVFLLVLVAGAVWYWGIRFPHSVPQQDRIGGLNAPVVLSRGDAGFTRIQGQTRGDLLAGLGYLHGFRRTWTAILWRQAALGELTNWFGSSVIHVDRWVRQLGLAERARQAYRSLPAKERRMLRRYADGFNAALRRQRLRTDEFVLMDIDPAVWEPWHSLVVMRLMAWLATPPLHRNLPAGVDSTAQADSTLKAWAQADRDLRRMLHLHGFHESMAWAIRTELNVRVGARLVYGTSALPLFEQVSLRGAVSDRYLLTVPGTCMVPFGKTSNRSWTVLLRSSYQWQHVAEGAIPSPQYVRIDGPEGREWVTRVYRRDSLLYASPQYRLGWAGFSLQSDVSAWLRFLAGGQEETFRLLDGHGLYADSTGSASVSGEPTRVQRTERGVVIGNSRWTSAFARRVTGDAGVPKVPGSDDPGMLPTYSPWADTLRAQFVRSVTGVRLWEPGLREGYTFLRNWNGVFSAETVAGSIFESWLASYYRTTGRLPDGVAETGQERIDRYRALKTGLKQLSEQFGSDPSRWRWEVVQPNWRVFPVLGDTSITGFKLGSAYRERYDTVSAAVGGHPTSLRWGMSIVDEDAPAPAVVEVHSKGRSQRIRVRYDVLLTEDILNRHLSGRSIVQMDTLSLREPKDTYVRLLPSE